MHFIEHLIEAIDAAPDASGPIPTVFGATILESGGGYTEIRFGEDLAAAFARVPGAVAASASVPVRSDWQ